MQLPDEKTLKEFERWKVAPPSHEEHGVADTFEHPLRERLISGNCTNWRLEGNELCCDSDFGPLRQVIPTDYIMTGVDAKGLPVFKKVGA